MNFSWDSVVSGLSNTKDDILETTPVESGLAIFEAITKTSTKGVSVTDSIVLKFLETIAKSTGNKVDDTLICMVKCYLKNK